MDANHFHKIIAACKRWKEEADRELATQLLEPVAVDEVGVYFHEPKEAEMFRLWSGKRGSESGIEFFIGDAQIMYEITLHEVPGRNHPVQRREYAYHVQTQTFSVVGASWRIQTQVPQTVAPVRSSRHPLFRKVDGSNDHLDTGMVLYCSYKVPDVERYLETTKANLLLRMENNRGRFAYLGTAGEPPYLMARDYQ